MKKIILKYDESIETDFAVEIIHRVIQEGEISGSRYGPQYCGVTVFGAGSRKIIVQVEKRKSGTQTFTVYREEER